MIARSGRHVMTEKPMATRWQDAKHMVSACDAAGIRLFVVDGYRVAKEAGLGTRVNTVLQTCFFALSKVLPVQEAVAAISRRLLAEYEWEHLLAEAGEMIP